LLLLENITMNSFLLSMSPNKLAVHILIKDEQNGQFSARILGLPEYQVLSCDRTSAINELEQKLANALSGSEVVALEVEISKPEHPWQQFAGQYKDSELFEAVLENIASNRHRLSQQITWDEAEEVTK
jgi:hypothetical protein